MESQQNSWTEYNPDRASDFLARRMGEVGLLSETFDMPLEEE